MTTESKPNEIALEYAFNFGTLKAEVQISMASIEHYQACVAAELKRLRKCIAECEQRLGERKGAER